MERFSCFFFTLVIMMLSIHSFQFWVVSVLEEVFLKLNGELY